MKADNDYIRIDIDIPGYKKWTYCRPLVDKHCIGFDKQGEAVFEGEPITADDLLHSERTRELIGNLGADISSLLYLSCTTSIKED